MLEKDLIFLNSKSREDLRRWFTKHGGKNVNDEFIKQLINHKGLKDYIKFEFLCLCHRYGIINDNDLKSFFQQIDLKENKAFFTYIGKEKQAIFLEQIYKKENRPSLHKRYETVDVEGCEIFTYDMLNFIEPNIQEYNNPFVQISNIFKTLYAQSDINFDKIFKKQERFTKPVDTDEIRKFFSEYKELKNLDDSQIILYFGHLDLKLLSEFLKNKKYQDEFKEKFPLLLKTATESCEFYFQNDFKKMIFSITEEDPVKVFAFEVWNLFTSEISKHAIENFERTDFLTQHTGMYKYFHKNSLIKLLKEQVFERSIDRYYQEPFLNEILAYNESFGEAKLTTEELKTIEEMKIKYFFQLIGIGYYMQIDTKKEEQIRARITNLEDKLLIDTLPAEITHTISEEQAIFAVQNDIRKHFNFGKENKNEIEFLKEAIKKTYLDGCEDILFLLQKNKELNNQEGYLKCRRYLYYKIEQLLPKDKDQTELQDIESIEEEKLEKPKMIEEKPWFGELEEENLPLIKKEENPFALKDIASKEMQKGKYHHYIFNFASKIRIYYDGNTTNEKPKTIKIKFKDIQNYNSFIHLLTDSNISFKKDTTWLDSEDYKLTIEDGESIQSFIQEFSLDEELEQYQNLTKKKITLEKYKSSFKALDTEENKVEISKKFYLQKYQNYDEQEENLNNSFLVETIQTEEVFPNKKKYTIKELPRLKIPQRKEESRFPTFNTIQLEKKRLPSITREEKSSLPRRIVNRLFSGCVAQEAKYTIISEKYDPYNPMIKPINRATKPEKKKGK